MERKDIRFNSQGLQCAGWFYPTSCSVGSPCIILAHGFGGIKEKRLDAYAEAFADSGYNALVFDYRHFGESEGEPRRVLDIEKQLEDWQAAIGFAREQEGVDPKRIILWGTSFSGGHVVSIAVKDGGIATVISQVPNLDGRATARANSFIHGVQLTYAALRDKFQMVLGRDPYYIPTFGKPGDLAAMTAPGILEASKKLYPSGYDPSNDKVAGRVFLKLVSYSPGKLAEKMTMPWLVQIVQYDNTTPIKPAIKAAMRAPQSRLIMYKCGHFDMYVPPHFKQVVQDEILFLKMTCPID